ncbi:Protein of unknown function [Propionibacterium freudenreichii]|nr:Protein of unknown function [Propionibacterium freudenreichii]
MMQPQALSTATHEYEASY